MKSMIYFLADDMNALYENSKPFSKFLKKQGLDGILQKTKLRLRDKHTIVPHVCGHALFENQISSSIDSQWHIAHDGSFTRITKGIACVFPG